ncbi:MAG: hypothetical protein JWM56_510 [Candidatus Peribacteria bacterium]|nr:hypothetical protein [Candidatus Peribacteria bacterium]
MGSDYLHLRICDLNFCEPKRSFIFIDWIIYSAIGLRAECTDFLEIQKEARFLASLCFFFLLLLYTA